MRAILLVVLGFSLVGSNLVEGGEGWRNDTSMLPQYCKDRVQGLRGPFAKWRNTFGGVFIHIHHYCSGLYAEIKAKSTFKRQRSRWLGVMAQEMNYVSNHCKVGCILYPELHGRWGWALAEKGQYQDAIEHFQLAIRDKPDYSMPYARLADMYVKQKNPDEARKVLETGLKANPRSRKLKNRLRRLEKTK